MGGPPALQALKLDSEMRRLAGLLRDETSLLVFGRGYNYATALEAALKVCGGEGVWVPGRRHLLLLPKVEGALGLPRRPSRVGMSCT